jgi:Transcriptional regulator containing an amidase domain and an AraC-type DNA-binding HTH domain
MTVFMEFSNRSSLDPLNINIRWLKEWQLNIRQHSGYLFPYTAIWLVLGGSAVIELNRIRYPLKKGDIVCIPSKTLQGWVRIDEDEAFHYISFACEAKVGMFDLIRLYRFPYVVSSADPEQFGELVRKWRAIAREYSSYLQWFKPEDLKTSERGYEHKYPSFTLNTFQAIQHMKIRSAGLDWMLSLFRALSHLLPEQPASYDTRVFEVCEYVEGRLDSPLSLDELADRAALSKEQLRALFQAAIGVSPMKYVRHARMQRAKELLTLTAHPIKEIAAAVGFADQHHFSRAFQQSESMSPIEYRRSQK